MTLRPAVLLTLAMAACALACSGVDEPARSNPAPDFDGIYRVSGTSVEIEGGSSRQISGLVVLRQEGDHYRTNFDLETEYLVENEGDGMSAALIGEGSGRVEGDDLRGSASTQFVLATVPGVHASFALLPRKVGPRIVSNTSAHMRSDGSIAIEIESRPRPGEQYSPTRTQLLGYRVGDVGRAPDLPPAVSSPGD